MENHNYEELIRERESAVKEMEEKLKSIDGMIVDNIVREIEDISKHISWDVDEHKKLRLKTSEQKLLDLVNNRIFSLGKAVVYGKDGYVYLEGNSKNSESDRTDINNSSGDFNLLIDYIESNNIKYSFYSIQSTIDKYQSMLEHTHSMYRNATDTFNYNRLKAKANLNPEEKDYLILLEKRIKNQKPIKIITKSPADTTEGTY